MLRRLCETMELVTIFLPNSTVRLLAGFQQRELDFGLLDGKVTHVTLAWRDWNAVRAASAVTKRAHPRVSTAILRRPGCSGFELIRGLVQLACAAATQFASTSLADHCLKPPLLPVRP